MMIDFEKANWKLHFESVFILNEAELVKLFKVKAGFPYIT